jgi:hypothetical protein
MDAKRKAALVQELSAGKGLTKPTFDPNYTKQNRIWFVAAVVDAVIADRPGQTDKEIEAAAREVISEANYAVALEYGFTVSGAETVLNAGTWEYKRVAFQLDKGLAKIERKDVARRVEIIYGVIAQNKELARVTAGNYRILSPMRKFISRRRYRAVVRMIYQVNPNTNGFMWYPDACDKPPLHLQVNVGAQPFWQKVDLNSDTPLKVKDQNNPAVAIAKIWEAPHPDPDECKGNLLDCSNAVCCMLLDSLGEAEDPEPFYKSIQQRATTDPATGQRREHLLIVNPNKLSEEHCLWDDPKEFPLIFTKELVKETDFQVGDHVDIENHGLYANVVPGGFWVSEHSLVTNCGNRNLNDGKGFLFGGHGVEQPFSINVLYDDLVKTIQTRLHRTFKMADLFLRFRQNPAIIPSAQWEALLAQDVTDPRSTQTVKVDAFRISFKVTYDNYQKKPVGGKRPTSLEGEKDNPLIMFDIPDIHQIAIARPTLKNTIQDQLARFDQSATMTFLQRDPPTGGGNYYDRAFWKIPFLDSNTDTTKLFPVFGGKDGTFKLLDRRDMPTGDGRYFRAGHPLDEPGALLTRPNVDTSNVYLDYLRLAAITEQLH